MARFQDVFKSKNKLFFAVNEALDCLGLPHEEFQISLTKNPKFGHFATNVGLVLAKKLGKDREKLAQQIAETIPLKKYSLQKIEVESPGFINFFVDEFFFCQTINDLIEKTGKVVWEPKAEKVLIEFVSANPTGLAHIGHARNMVVGSILSRVFELCGWEVVREYYINDGGVQVTNLASSVLAYFFELVDPTFRVDTESLAYKGEDIQCCAKALFESSKEKLLSLNKNQQTDFATKFGVNYFLEEIKKDALLLNCAFDVFTSELSLREKGKVEEVFQKLKSLGCVYQKDGAWFLASSKQGEDEKDRVLRKSNGEFTYITPDIAYHFDKLTRYPNLMLALNIWGSDHIGYVPRLKSSLKFLNLPLEKLEIVTLQQVRLLKEGKEFKMSKRAGNTVFVRELVEVLGPDAAIFFLAAYSTNSTINVDVEFASKRTLDNPVFALQYSYARACQLLKKSGKSGFRLKSLSNPEAVRVVQTILEFPQVLHDVVRTLKPELLCYFGLKMAQNFNSFYSLVPVIGSKTEESLLAVVKAFELTQKQVLMLLGLTIKEEV